MKKSTKESLEDAIKSMLALAKRNKVPESLVAKIFIEGVKYADRHVSADEEGGIGADSNWYTTPYVMKGYDIKQLENYLRRLRYSERKKEEEDSELWREIL